MIQVFAVYFLGIKRETVSIANPVINVDYFKGSRLFISCKGFPWQLLSFGKLGRRTYDHIFHRHERMKYIALSGSICTVHGKDRK